MSTTHPSAALKFGTSGIRGHEDDLTNEECTRFARAFIRHYRKARKAPAAEICIIAGDLRRSTPRILEAVSAGLALEGVTVLNAGIIPTPALAYECSQRHCPGIMVTGSHIPADRNGIKFYFPWGEILKGDEAPILAEAQAIHSEGSVPKAKAPQAIPAKENFEKRYTEFFAADALQGLKIVFYEHSSAARDLYPVILERLGAQVVRILRSEEFVPVDTEALQNVQALAAQVSRYEAHALISTDGDGDRPLLLDGLGQVVRGDQIGILSALALKADSVSTPVSSSTALEETGAFKEIRRCKIGSPFVAAAMLEALSQAKKRVVGFEANGGFLLGSSIPSESSPGVLLKPLPTRDCVLPVLLLLASARKQSKTLAELVATLPARYTESDLIRPFPIEKSQALVQKLSRGGLEIFTAEWAPRLGRAKRVNQIDGIRVTFDSSEILHFRPSGNAPEFRIYSEARTEARAREINGWAKEWVGRLASSLQ